MKKIENLLVTMVVLRLYSCHVVTVKMVQYDDRIKGKKKKKKKGLTCCGRQFRYTSGGELWSTSRQLVRQVVNKSELWGYDLFLNGI
jgi:hypothetical protein